MIVSLIIKLNDVFLFSLLSFNLFKINIRNKYSLFIFGVYNHYIIFRFGKTITSKTKKSNKNISTTQYQFLILYLPTQIQMVIVFRKAALNAGVKDFLIIRFVLQKKENLYLKAKNRPHATQIYILKYVFV